MLKIEKCSDGLSAILRLSGRIESEHVQVLQAQLESCPQTTLMDLEEVKLVNRDAVRFLGVCENDGIELLNCPLYIREWIFRETGRKSR